MGRNDSQASGAKTQMQYGDNPHLKANAKREQGLVEKDHKAGF